MRQALIAACLFVVAAPPAVAAGVPEEFRIKRSGPFEFAQKPAVTCNGDAVTIAFASKGWCDVTVAIENIEGRIIRHLASGVLGNNAPPPFQKDSLKQSVVWDGNDDAGDYVGDNGRTEGRWDWHQLAA